MGIPPRNDRRIADALMELEQQFGAVSCETQTIPTEAVPGAKGGNDQAGA
jgi:hypothetical protein